MLYFVDDFAELYALANSTDGTALDGDTIRWTSSTPFVATRNLTIEKSLSFDALPGILAVLDMGNYDLTIEGQVGGTVQFWRAPRLTKSSKPTADSPVIAVQCTDGDATINLYQDNVDAGNAAMPGGRSRGSGIGAVCTNQAFRVVVNCYNCDASNCGNQGFFTNVSGFTPAANDHFYAIINLYNRCSGSNHDEEGSSAHGGTTINEYDSVYSGVGEYPFSPGIKCTQTASRVIATVGALYGGIDGQGICLVGESNIWTAEDCTFDCPQLDATAWSAATALPYGTFIKSVAATGTRSPGLIFTYRHAKWTALNNYSVGNFIEPTIYNGCYYEATVDAGSSGATEPTDWPTVAGATKVDGGITWTCRTTGTTGATEPTWNFGSGNTTNEGTGNQIRWLSVNNHMIRVAAHSGTPATLTMRRCNITIGRNTGILNVAGPVTALFEDCTITLTGDYRNLNTNAIVIGSAVLNTNVKFRRCKFILSGCTTSGTLNRSPFAADSATSATTSLNFEDCLFISPTNTFWTSTNTAFIQFAASSTGSVEHCTFIGVGQTYLEPVTIGTGATVTINGCIFSGWRRHLQYSGAVYSCTRSCFYNPSSGVYINDSGGNKNPNGVSGNVVGDPLFISATAPVDARLQDGSPAAGLDTATTARQIESYALTLVSDGPGTIARTPAATDAFAAPTDAGCYVNRQTGLSVTLVATPDSDATLVGWTGDYATAVGDTATVVMTSAKTVHAHFMADAEKVPPVPSPVPAAFAASRRNPRRG